MSANEQARTIDDLATALERRYVFADIGRQYAARLRARRQTYAHITSTDEFGDAVTRDLQSVHADTHLRLATEVYFGVSRDEASPAASSPGPLPPPPPPALREVRMIGDVAYLNFTEFPNDPALAERVRSFLVTNQRARAVVIDARENHGGSLPIINVIASLIYAEPTTLLRMDLRAASAETSSIREGPHLIRRPSSPEVVRFDHVAIPDRGHNGLQHTPVFYLISHETASAAEHLALALKRTRRATLIGETTRGAGHFGSLLPIGDRFAAFVPDGRTFDPDTGEGWEARGVSPDVATSSSDALEEAMRRIGPIHQ